MTFVGLPLINSRFPGQFRRNWSLNIQDCSLILLLTFFTLFVYFLLYFINNLIWLYRINILYHVNGFSLQTTTRWSIFFLPCQKFYHLVKMNKKSETFLLVIFFISRRTSWSALCTTRSSSFVSLVNILSTSKVFQTTLLAVLHLSPLVLFFFLIIFDFYFFLSNVFLQNFFFFSVRSAVIEYLLICTGSTCYASLIWFVFRYKILIVIVWKSLICWWYPRYPFMLSRLSILPVMVGWNFSQCNGHVFFQRDFPWLF